MKSFHWKFVLIFIFLLKINCAFASNIEKIGVIKYLEDQSLQLYKHHVIETIESFGFEPVIINYLTLVDWDILNGKSKDFIEKEISYKLKEFLKINKINKIILAGDNFNYNVPPYHPEPKARPRFTKAIAEMERDGLVKVIGICGGMQGLLHFNGIKMVKVSEEIGDKRAQKYLNASEFLSTDYYLPQKIKYHSCESPVNKLFINPNSSIGRLMIEAEKFYNIKYERNKNNFLITHIPSSHSNVPDNSLESIIHLYEKNFHIVGLSEDDLIYIVEDKYGNLLIEGHPELIANINRCSDFSKEDVIFSRLLFWNLLNNGEPMKIFTN